MVAKKPLVSRPRLQKFFQQSVPTNLPLQTIKISMIKIFPEQTAATKHVTLHQVLYHYTFLCFGPHLCKHYPAQPQCSIWDLFMTVANCKILEYLDTHHWKIALTACYNMRPMYPHSVGSFARLSSGYHLPNLLLHVGNYHYYMHVRQHLSREKTTLQCITNSCLGAIMSIGRFKSHCLTGLQQ